MTDSKDAKSLIDDRMAECKDKDKKKSKSKKPPMKEDAKELVTARLTEAVTIPSGGGGLGGGSES